MGHEIEPDVSGVGGGGERRQRTVSRVKPDFADTEVRTGRLRKLPHNLKGALGLW